MAGTNETQEWQPFLDLVIRDVHDHQARKRTITVRSWSTVEDVKNAIQKAFNVPSGAQRLYYGPLMTSGGELPNYRKLYDLGIEHSGETLMLVTRTGFIDGDSWNLDSSLRTAADLCVSSSLIDKCPSALFDIARHARQGLAVGLKPELSLDGSGGAYFLRDATKAEVAVFKPSDEEPHAENNPRGYNAAAYNDVDSLRAGVLPGEACLREVAAYLLDHDGFSGVPMTTLAEARHPAFHSNGEAWKVIEGGASVGTHSLNPQSPGTLEDLKKVGSLQAFVKTSGTMDDIHYSKISRDEVHKIAILDIRLMNADRNPANLLYIKDGWGSEESYELVPIDHGYCLRDVCDVITWDWCWLDWPQLKEPLSEESKRYIESLDIDADAEMLKERLKIDGKAIEYFRASSMLLQAGVKAGLTLYDVAVMCCRSDREPGVPSKIEVLTSMACELAEVAVGNGQYHHVAASKALAAHLSPEGGGAFLETPTRELPAGIFKSKSSAHLVAFGEDSRHSPTNDVPAMTQSTGSETSSVDDASEEPDECNDWAERIVAERLEQSISMLRSHDKSRAESICSDYSQSSAPKGFWQDRAPGSCPDDEEDLDSDSVSWSPHTSKNLLDRAETLSTDEGEVDNAFLSPSPTNFTESFTAGFPATVDVSVFKNKSSSLSSSCGFFVPLRQRSSGINRSRSVSDLRRSASTISSRSGEASGRLAPIDESEQLFTKFVDLVIVRETTALASMQSM